MIGILMKTFHDKGLIEIGIGVGENWLEAH